MSKELEQKLIVGTKIKIGKQYAEEFGFQEGQILELVEGHFEYENGLYTEDQYCPAVWDEEQQDFDSIYHLFGNDLEDWMDCEIIEITEAMSEQDEKRIENSFNTSDAPVEASGAWVGGAIHGAKKECEYWQSKLKERDELLEEMWSLWESMAECGELRIGPNFNSNYKSIKTRYSNLKAK